MSQWCQEETHAPQQLIGLYERICRRNIKNRTQRQGWQKQAAAGLRAATAFSLRAHMAAAIAAWRRSSQR
jgi:hypothetical protein